MIRRFRKWLWKHDVVNRAQLFWCSHGGYRLALWLDKRHPDWCWAIICLRVGMARGDVIGWREEAASSAVTCRRESLDKTGTCWCGKFRDPDRMEQFLKELEARNA